MLTAYAIVGGIVFVTMLSLAEMAAFVPIAGSFCKYPPQYSTHQSSHLPTSKRASSWPLRGSSNPSHPSSSLSSLAGLSCECLWLLFVLAASLSEAARFPSSTESLHQLSPISSTESASSTGISQPQRGGSSTPSY
ncbi:hypothetical protein DTO280E4_2338 [Paecilomyces variotii]|nr:hypothetical protein DTO280E4_2338 [Paecilomyces variotii]KAJ9386442.1 hypothetical protein DTO063F5_3705 [Paecilomyces variotii]